MNFTNFTQHFGLPPTTHRHIDFVDVPVNTDVKLFLDPGLIDAGCDEFSQKCSVIISSYFDAVFHCCRRNDITALTSFLNYSAEPNETHLGNSVAHSQGRGASLDILINVFEEMIDSKLFQHNIIIHPCDIYVLAPNFDKDRMSDLITNILRSSLIEFTIAQCGKIGIPLEGLYEAPFWDMENARWSMGKWQVPVANAKPVILVPKTFVGKNYHFGTSSYISKYLLEFRQKYHLDNHTPLCYERELKNGQHKLLPPTKKEIKAQELSGISMKQHAIDFALSNPRTMQQFSIERQNGLSAGTYFISDRELDLLLYPQRFKAV